MINFFEWKIEMTESLKSYVDIENKGCFVKFVVKIQRPILTQKELFCAFILSLQLFSQKYKAMST